MDKEQRIRELESYRTLRILRSLDEKIQKLDLTEDEKELIEEAFDWLYTDEKLRLYGIN
jgi:hypothetical protein